jgi:hypothetical protein
MNRYIQAAAVCGACLAIAAAAHATAPIMTLTLTDGVFDDGGTFSGSISAPEYTSDYTWDITTTSGSSLSGTEYTSNSAVDTLTQQGFEFEFSAGLPDGTTFDIDLDQLALSGTVSGDEYAYTSNASGSPSRNITSGDFTITASGVPEPAAWAMMLMGTAFAGAALRRRPAALAS